MVFCFICNVRNLKPQYVLTEPVYLLLGSNVGDKRKNLGDALHLLQNKGVKIRRISSVYASAPWGKTDQDWFENQCAEVISPEPPEGLMRICMEAEQELGRVRRELWEPRIIDIDILLWGELVSENPLVQIPHPRLRERKFALLPLAELLPDAVHPLSGKTILHHLGECNDPLEVIRL
jgi:2-amino-4-hydroxy-6-hydroxymethyldihydropteridine diphosphokinase